MFSVNQDKTKYISLALSLSLLGSPSLGLAAAVTKVTATSSRPSLVVSEGQTHQYLEVPLSKTKILKISAPVSRISVSSPDMIGFVVLSPTEIQVIGKQIGSSSILIWTEKSGKNYIDVDVSVHRDVITLNEKIKLIDPNVNVQPVPAEDAIILTGTASSKETAQYIMDVAKAFYSSGSSDSQSASATGATPTASATPKIINMIHVPGEPLTKEEQVQAKLVEINKTILLAVIPGKDGSDKAILTGKVRNGTEVAKAINLTSMFYGTPGIKVISGPGGVLVNTDTTGNNAQTAFAADDTSSPALVNNLDKNIQQGSIITDASGNVISMLTVTERPQVKCQIQILEVRKSINFVSALNSYFRSNDVTLASQAGTTAGASAILPGNVLSLVTGANAAQLGIRWSQDVATFVSGLVTNGKARILAEPSITTISGERGTFLAGGEFPVPTSSANGQINVTFKEFGIRLNVLPTVTDRGTIHMQVSPEVSSLDATAGVILNSITIPGLRTRKSSAVVEMKEGSSFVLSGLYSEDMTKSVGKTPLLGQIPILGELFRSRSYQKSETELVIVIYPEIVRDMDDVVESATAETSSIPVSTNSTVMAPLPHLKDSQEEVMGLLAVSGNAPDEANVSNASVSPVQSKAVAKSTLHSKSRRQKLLID